MDKKQGSKSFDSNNRGPTYASSNSMSNSAHNQSPEYTNDNYKHQETQDRIKGRGSQSSDSHDPLNSMSSSAHKHTPDRKFEKEQTVQDLKYFGRCENFENTPSNTKKIRYFGYPSENIEKEFTVLLVGASKSGKSTLVDFIYNFFMGISSPKKKYPNVTKNSIENGAFFTYTFCTDDNTGFTFIDSPSINNSKGFIDNESKQNFCLSVNDMINAGLKINALGFVVQNHFVRLGPAEESILRFVTGLLGDDNLHHIVPFITYADANTPPVLHALRRFGIRTDQYLVVNNVCVNIRPSRITELSEMYWEDGLKNIQKGLDIIMTLKNVNLKVESETINYTEPDNEDFNRINGGEQDESSSNKKSRNKRNTYAGRSNKQTKKEDSRNVFGGSLRGKSRNKAQYTSTSESQEFSNTDNVRGSISNRKKSTNKQCTIL